MTAQREPAASEELAGATWHTSSYSGSGNQCVEHGRLPSGVQAVRDTKDRDHGVLLVGPDTWRSFVDAVQSDSLSA